MPQTSVGTTGIQIAPPNAFRKSIVFSNTNAANNIFLDNAHPAAVTTTTSGIRVPANGSWSFDIATDGVDRVTAEWSAISDAGTNTLVWQEFTGDTATDILFRKLGELFKVVTRG